MTDHLHKYHGAKIYVTYDVKRCMHAAECLRGLPSVFDTDRKPWISPDAAEVRLVAEVVMRCPSGALHYESKDDLLPETPDENNSITVAPNGPLYLRGEIVLQDSSGNEILHETRVALCRCGASGNKPFCDNSHRRIGFKNLGNSLADPEEDDDSDVAGTGLTVQSTENGPYLVSGSVEIRASRGGDSLMKANTALCRCGGSNNKPFCDGTHESNGFIAE